jgi:5-formyltetrahydrofolate cyclo-ligase
MHNNAGISKMRTKKDGLKRTRQKLGMVKKLQLKKAISENKVKEQKKKAEALALKEKVVSIFKKTKHPIDYSQIKSSSRIDNDYQLRKIIKLLLKEGIIIEEPRLDKYGYKKEEPTYLPHRYKLRI